ncbi:MAG: hypothetical protein ACK47B_18415 [Armatimonadota bacterium]
MVDFEEAYAHRHEARRAFARLLAVAFILFVATALAGAWPRWLLSPLFLYLAVLYGLEYVNLALHHQREDFARWRGIHLSCLAAAAASSWMRGVGMPPVRHVRPAAGGRDPMLAHAFVEPRTPGGGDFTPNEGPRKDTVGEISRVG